MAGFLIRSVIDIALHKDEDAKQRCQHSAAGGQAHRCHRALSCSARFKSCEDPASQTEVDLTLRCRRRLILQSASGERQCAEHCAPRDVIFLPEHRWGTPVRFRRTHPGRNALRSCISIVHFSRHLKHETSYITLDEIELGSI